MQIEENARSAKFWDQCCENQKIREVMDLHAVIAPLQIKQAEAEKGQDEEHQVFDHLDGRSDTPVPFYGQAEDFHTIHLFEWLFALISQTNNIYLITALDQRFGLALDARFSDRIMRMNYHAVPHCLTIQSLDIAH